MHSHDEARIAGPEAAKDGPGRSLSRSIGDGPAAPSASAASTLLDLQRRIGNAAVSRMLATDTAQDPPIQRSPVLEVVGKGGGQPLEPVLRREMESRLGASFGSVRIHADAAATRSAEAVQANAYTVGNDVVFRSDRWNPDSTEGKTTLAHELTHVVQQDSGPVSGTPTADGIRVSDPADPFEVAAESTARAAMAGPAPAQLGVSAGSAPARGPAGVQRRTAGNGDEDQLEEPGREPAVEAGSQAGSEAALDEGQSARDSSAPATDQDEERDETAQRQVRQRETAVGTDEDEIDPDEERTAQGQFVQRAPAPPLPSAASLQREGEGTPSGPGVKHTYTLIDHELGEEPLSYAKATLSVGGSVDYEVTPPAIPAAAEPKKDKPEGDAAAPKPLASPADAQVKGSGGVGVSPTELKYQAEVGVEFEKRATGLFEGFTPKAKIGGEASGDKGKLGIELSMEGQVIEPKFGFNLVELDATKGIHFATFEVANDWKIHEWTFTASDGSTIKITPKVTLKVAIEPNYEKIFQYILEEVGAEVAMEALIAGGFIVGGVAVIAGTLLTLGDGEDEARAVENAEKGRQDVIAGFVAGATGEQPTSTTQFGTEGYRRGQQWREDLKNGKLGRGIPVPPSVIDSKSKESTAKLQESAKGTADQIFHNALVLRYWEIHYIERYLGWSEINTPFMMLMEGQDFGRPQPQEGKNAAGVSTLAE